MTSMATTILLCSVFLYKSFQPRSDLEGTTNTHLERKYTKFQKIVYSVRKGNPRCLGVGPGQLVSSLWAPRCV